MVRIVSPDGRGLIQTCRQCSKCGKVCIFRWNAGKMQIMDRCPICNSSLGKQPVPAPAPTSAKPPVPVPLPEALALARTRAKNRARTRNRARASGLKKTSQLKRIKKQLRRVRK